MTSRSMSDTGGGSCEMNFNNVRVTNRTEQTGSKEMLNIVQWRRALQYAAAFTGKFFFGAGIG